MNTYRYVYLAEMSGIVAAESVKDAEQQVKRLLDDLRGAKLTQIERLDVPVAKIAPASG